jgi:hypothetical protein
MNNNPRKYLPIPLFAFALIFILPALPVLANLQQQELPLQQNQVQSQQDPQNKLPVDTEAVTQNDTSNDRLFWTLPNLLAVENAGQAPRLTSKGKFKVALRTSFDLAVYPYVGILAGISQAQNSEPGYGQGAAGYWKRYGATFADNADETFWTTAILPSLLHQDPRYYRLGKGGFLHRFGYAVSRQFITRSDLKHGQFNFSEIAGSAISAGISNAYHPAGDRTFANTMSVWWTQLGWDTVVGIAKEFWPDIRRKTSNHNGTNPRP